jgi:hypothetical protein
MVDQATAKESAHGGPNYERTVASGTLTLELPRW